jgi:hypothetical protein
MEEAWHAKFVSQFAEYFEIRKTSFGKYWQAEKAKTSAPNSGSVPVPPKVQPWAEELNVAEVLEEARTSLTDCVSFRPSQSAFFIRCVESSQPEPGESESLDATHPSLSLVGCRPGTSRENWA